jgi:16S rRNA (cytosine967-C5)-methyltransferase
LVRAVVSGLESIFAKKQYADKVIERLLRSNPRWGARDRAFIAENIYDIVRHWRRYTEALGLSYQDAPTEAQLWLIFGVHQMSQGYYLPNWEEFAALDPAQIEKRLNQLLKRREVMYSIPDWLDQLGYEAFGKRWEAQLDALQQEAPVVLRTNTLKTSVSELKAALQADDIDTYRLTEYPQALVLKERKPVFKHPLFKEGWFEVQDAGSQFISQQLDIQPGMRVIDACAGAGGKALHLAALMENKGKLIAMDVEEYKLQELKRRARRAGISVIEPRLIDSNKAIKRLAQSADRLLLDVPCSGLGVLRRNPDAKWKLQPEFVEKIQQVQQDILQRYSTMLKVGGKMIYATCSLLPQENEHQVQKFLTNHGAQFRLLSEWHLSPTSHNTDGFYLACLERIAE